MTILIIRVWSGVVTITNMHYIFVIIPYYRVVAASYFIIIIIESLCHNMAKVTTRAPLSSSPVVFVNILATVEY